MTPDQLAAIEGPLRIYHDAAERLVLDTVPSARVRRERADAAKARLTMRLLDAGVCTVEELALRLIEGALRG